MKKLHYKQLHCVNLSIWRGKGIEGEMFVSPKVDNSSNIYLRASQRIYKFNSSGKHVLTLEPYGLSIDKEFPDFNDYDVDAQGNIYTIEVPTQYPKDICLRMYSKKGKLCGEFLLGYFSSHVRVDKSGHLLVFSVSPCYFQRTHGPFYLHIKKYRTNGKKILDKYKRLPVSKVIDTGSSFGHVVLDKDDNMFIAMEMEYLIMKLDSCGKLISTFKKNSVDKKVSGSDPTNCLKSQKQPTTFENISNSFFCPSILSIAWEPRHELLFVHERRMNRIDVWDKKGKCETFYINRSFIDMCFTTSSQLCIPEFLNYGKKAYLNVLKLNFERMGLKN